MPIKLSSLFSIPLLALAFPACGHEPPRAAGPKQAGPPHAVRTAEATRVAGGEVTVPATVRPRLEAALAARIPASVAALPFREGQRVEKGAVVVRLDDAALRAAVTAAEAVLKAAQADLERIEGLLAKGAATPRERDEAAARAAGARAALEGARDNLSYAVLRAPFSGRVASRPVDVGDVVNPGATLISIEADQGLEVRATVDSALVSQLHPGLVLKALVDGRNEPLAAKVRSVAPSGDPTTHRFEVRADLPPTAGLKAGLFARLVVQAPAAEPRILVPAESVFERGGLTGVFVVETDTARLRWVAAGATAQGRTEIRAGLEPGEHVVLDPAGLSDGSPVREQK